MTITAQKGERTGALLEEGFVYYKMNLVDCFKMLIVIPRAITKKITLKIY